MVETTVSKGCEYLGRIPCNVKFLNEIQLDDGSYVSCIYPSGKLRKKGFKPIQVRVIEYTIENFDRPGTQIRYRLITSLLDAEKFTAQLLACEYHQRWEVENTIDELKVHLLGRKTHIRSQKPCISCARNLWFTTRALGCQVIDFSSGKQRQPFPLASFFYWNITSCSSRTPKNSGVTTTRTSLFLSWLTWEILEQNIPERVSDKQPKSREKTWIKISV
jgi:DDE family transposase